mgnify:CR=1 FL=1
MKLEKKFRFGSKAETLSRLGPHLEKCTVPKFRHFNLNRWQLDHDKVLEEIKAFADGESKIIVRSSSCNEDGEFYAQAGAFLSAIHACGADAADNAVVRCCK